MNLMLSLLFSIHLGVALLLFAKKRKAAYAIAAAAFLCLLASVLAGESSLLGTEVSTLFRGAAIALSCTCLGLRLTRRPPPH